MATQASTGMLASFHDPGHFCTRHAPGKQAFSGPRATGRVVWLGGRWCEAAGKTALLLLLVWSGLHCAAGGLHPAAGAELRLVRRPADPYGSPRPGNGEEHVPVATSLFMQVQVAGDAEDAVLQQSLNLSLHGEGLSPVPLIRDGQMVAGASGWIRSGEANGPAQLQVYVELPQALQPLTRYTVRLACRSQKGLELHAADRTWQFTTEPPARPQRLEFALDLREPGVRWEDGLFTGYGTTGFCISRAMRLGTYERMHEVRKWSPRAWSIQRHFWLTGMELAPSFLQGNLPNLVRERQTRHVREMQPDRERVGLVVEDFFGHEQYGIEPNRSLADDYRAGDEVLIFDVARSARTRVLDVDRAQSIIWVMPFEPAPGDWKLAYSPVAPTKPESHTPGRFAAGGCYVCKFSPPGTPAYFWDRLDQEYDLACGRFGQRLVVNFADAPGDLSRDGRNWTTAKDYAQLHEVVREIAGHIIDRYGERTLDFVWSVFNEPDLGPLFWRADWNELQTFYDYTVDAVLRAFEDRGYDSRRVLIGGLELGGIFGTNLKLREFLAHCSPAAEAPGAIEQNAAFADSRLVGRRSRRVEELCRASGGRGAPCDFISIHAYNRSRLMAEKLIRAKEMALEADPEYFARLRIHSHECCPGWDVPPDPAYAHSYLGNGYFPTWCADVARRRLARAAEDERYANGEMLLTFWAMPVRGLDGRNDCVRELLVDDDADGRPDRTETLPMPILHFLGLLAQFGPQYHVLPEYELAGHVASGFASQDNGALRLLVYSHHMLDTQSRSQAEFIAILRIEGLPEGKRRVKKYAFDRQRNSYYELACVMRAEHDAATRPSPEEEKRIDAALAALQGEDLAARGAALAALRRMGKRAYSIRNKLFAIAFEKRDPQFQAELLEVVKELMDLPIISRAEYDALAARAQLDLTDETLHEVGADGRLAFELPLSANAAWIVVIEPWGE